MIQLSWKYVPIFMNYLICVPIFMNYLIHARILMNIFETSSNFDANIWYMIQFSWKSLVHAHVSWKYFIHAHILSKYFIHDPIFMKLFDPCSNFMCFLSNNLKQIPETWDGFWIDLGWSLNITSLFKVWSISSKKRMYFYRMCM